MGAFGLVLLFFCSVAFAEEFSAPSSPQTIVIVPPQETAAPSEPNATVTSERLEPAPSAQGQVEDWDPDVPRRYQQPTDFAFSLAFSPRAYGRSTEEIDLGVYRTNGIEAQIEWMPRITQNIGMFGVGGTAAIYPVTEGHNTMPVGRTQNAWSVWSMGGILRYQARYLRRQILVPYAAISVETLRYRLRDNTNGTLFLAGPRVGLYLFADLIDEEAAAWMYLNSGVARTYLLGEMRLHSGNNTAFKFDGTGYFLGVRVEL